jgi:hypothetical protein
LFARYPWEKTMATALDPFLRNAVFESDVTHTLAVAFDDICREKDLPVGATVAREVLAG